MEHRKPTYEELEKRYFALLRKNATRRSALKGLNKSVIIKQHMVNNLLAQNQVLAEEMIKTEAELAAAKKADNGFIASLFRG